jgi:hypothetical protein
MQIIPQSCLTLLPFAAQPVPAWGEDSDLLRFLTCLFDKPAVLIDSRGTKYQGTYSSYGRYLYEHGVKKVLGLSESFGESARAAKPAPAASTKLEPVPDFSGDSNFGLMAKYYVAWDGVTSEVLSESAFFSIAHVLESEAEIDCSILLASKLYYKQALQVLRNYIEGAILQLYLSGNLSAFSDWKANAFRIPSFRGRNGMLENLISRGILPGTLADEASALYGELNGSIHGAEDKLIHRGTFTREWSGLIFQYDCFQEWCGYRTQCITLGIHLLHIGTNLWQEILAADTTGIYCSTCHSKNNFDASERQIPGHAVTTLECRTCGNRMTFGSDWVRSRGAT